MKSRTINNRAEVNKRNEIREIGLGRSSLIWIVTACSSPGSPPPPEDTSQENRQEEPGGGEV